MNVFLLTMGCAKNAVDSERLGGRLVSAGHRIVASADEAEVGIINTCGFIQDAVKENVDAILDLEAMKGAGTLRHIVVAGCLVNRYEAELRKELPSVDLFAWAEDWDRIVDWLAEADRSAVPGRVRRRVALGEGVPWTRYLKVGEGCDTFCSYCAIPLIRGRLRSAPVEDLVGEALALCREGARELCLVGQDLTAYGTDLYGEPGIRRLLTALDAELPQGVWVRLLYMHPDRMTEDLVDFLCGRRTVLRYLDVPIQHVDDDVLARMNRRTTGEHIRRIFRHVRENDPLFAIRTTIMTGFPGETERQFGRVLDFLEEAELDRVGAFVYSPEEGTPAASFPDQVPHSTAEERYARLMELQAGITQARSELFLGRDLDVLVEDAEPPEGGSEGEVWGRSYRDAPEVDGAVCAAGTAARGDLVRVRVTDCEECDLFGTLEARP